MSTVKHRFYGRWRTLPLLVVLLASSEISTASSYLQELENEAAASAGRGEPETPAEKPEWTPRQTILKENIDPGLNKAQFEEALKSRFYGSFLFYSTLAPKKQQQVYEEYLANNEIEHLREIIKTQMTN